MQENDEVLLFCSECKHVKKTYFDGGDLFSSTYRCKKTERRSVDLVTGKVTLTSTASRCSYVRDGKVQCGEEGKWWEPKNTKKHLFTMLSRT
jgi:hypothetical protein